MGFKQVPALASYVRYQISKTIEDPAAAKMLREGYVDDIFTHKLFGECAVAGDHDHCTDGEILALRCKEIDEGLRKGHLHFGDKWVSDLPVVPPDCPNIRGIDNETRRGRSR